jgi:hypothetical protein
MALTWVRWKKMLTGITNIGHPGVMGINEQAGKLDGCTAGGGAA